MLVALCQQKLAQALWADLKNQEQVAEDCALLSF
jgi:hypothetical protein